MQILNLNKNYENIYNSIYNYEKNIKNLNIELTNKENNLTNKINAFKINEEKNFKEKKELYK